MKRAFFIAGIVVSSLLTPLSLLPALFLVNTVNPMALAFVTSFEVANESGEILRVTPIGTSNNGYKRILPTFSRRFPAIPRLARKPYIIAPGETRRILFDCDHINFSDLSIQNASGELRQFVADPNPPTNGYYAPRKILYTIPKWSELQSIQPSVLVAMTTKGSFIQSWWIMGAMCIPLLALIGFSRALISDKKQRRKQMAEQPARDNA